MSERGRFILVTGGCVAAAGALLIAFASIGSASSPEQVEVTVRRTSCAITSYYDVATNCEYLVSACGGVTPRLDALARPICRPFKPGASGPGVK